MSRVLILSEDPPTMTRHETAAWLQALAEELSRLPSIRGVSTHRLTAGGGDADWSNWLIELHGTGTDAMQRESLLTELLEQLGRRSMCPRVLVVHEDR